MKRKAPKRIPKRLWRYFWDVNVKKLDPSKKPYFVVNRLLDKGNTEAVRWVRRNYSKELIKDTFFKMRDFNEKTGRFWSLFLKIPQDKVKCLDPSYLKTRKELWPY